MSTQDCATFSSGPKLHRYLVSKILSYILDEVVIVSTSCDFNSVHAILSACSPNDLKEYRDVILWNLCRKGNTRALIRCFTMLQVKDHTNIFGMFDSICKNGHGAAAKWLAAKFELIIPHYRSSGRHTFEHTCENGHMRIAKWLTAEYKFVRDDFKAGQKHVLVRICQDGHLDLAKWLVSNFGFQPEGDHFFTFNLAFRNACTLGRLDVAKWLRTTFINCSTFHDDVFMQACTRNHLETAQWLATEFKIGRTELRGPFEVLFIFQAACRFDHLDMAKWLALWFNLTEKEFQEFQQGEMIILIRGLTLGKTMEKISSVARTALQFAQDVRNNKLLYLTGVRSLS